MKNFKYIMMAAAIFAGASLTSCSDDDDNYTVGEQSVGAYLYSDFSSKTYLPADELTFNIKIGRTSTDGAKTIALSIDNDKFSAPSSVTFNDGEGVVTVPVTFDMEIGTTEEVQFVIPTDESTVYGDDTLSLSITRDYTWEVIGTADFTDDIFTGASATVDVAKAKEGTNLYKFVSPMTTLYQQNGEETLPGAADLKFTMDEEGNASMSDGFYDVETGTSLIEGGAYTFYYNNTRYPSYCYLQNDNGVFTLSTLLYDGASLYGPYTWTFDWNVGYPLASEETEGE